MEARDLVLVGTGEGSVVDDELAADVEPLDPMRGREDEPVDRIRSAAELEPVQRPDSEIRALSRAQ